MENLDPESAYIIRINANGNKNIDCVADYEKRTQKNNNIRMKYLRGDYEGIPLVNDIDFEELAEEAFDQYYTDGGSNE